MVTGRHAFDADAGDRCRPRNEIQVDRHAGRSGRNHVGAELGIVETAAQAVDQVFRRELAGMLPHQVICRLIAGHSGPFAFPAGYREIGTDEPAARFHVVAGHFRIPYLKVGGTALGVGHTEIGFDGPGTRPVLQQAREVRQRPAGREGFVHHLAVGPFLVFLLRQVVGSVVHDGETGLVGAAECPLALFVGGAENRRIGIFPAPDVDQDIVGIVGIALFPQQRPAGCTGVRRNDGGRTGAGAGVAEHEGQEGQEKEGKASHFVRILYP